MFKGNVRYTGGRGSHLNRKGTFRLLEPNMYFQTMTLSGEPLHNDCFRKDLPLQHGRASVKRVNSEPGVICWQLWGVFLPNFSKPPSSLSGRVKVGNTPQSWQVWFEVQSGSPTHFFQVSWGSGPSKIEVVSTSRAWAGSAEGVQVRPRTSARRRPIPCRSEASTLLPNICFIKFYTHFQKVQNFLLTCIQ